MVPLYDLANMLTSMKSVNSQENRDQIFRTFRMLMQTVGRINAGNWYPWF